jgi:hypothetical protein
MAHDHYCYLPLYVFSSGQAMLACLLRPSRIDGARHAAAVIKLLIGQLREAWPEVRLIIRADSGFCRQRLLHWCERHKVGYLIGVAKNVRLQHRVKAWEAELETAYGKAGIKQRAIREFRYAADSWNIERRIVTRLEYGDKGTNPRFVVSNLDHPPAEL